MGKKDKENSKKRLTKAEKTVKDAFGIGNTPKEVHYHLHTHVHKHVHIVAGVLTEKERGQVEAQSAMKAEKDVGDKYRFEGF